MKTKTRYVMYYKEWKQFNDTFGDFVFKEKSSKDLDEIKQFIEENNIDTNDKYFSIIRIDSTRVDYSTL